VPSKNWKDFPDSPKVMTAERRCAQILALNVFDKSAS